MKGFTYLELMVSIAIMVIIVVSLYGAFTFNVETMQKVSHQGEVSRISRTVLDRMSKDIESVFLGKGMGLVLEERTISGGEADRIEMITLAGVKSQRGGARTDLKRVTYFRKQKAGDRGFSLYRREEGIAGAGIAIGGKERELARGVKALHIAFTDGSGAGPDEWPAVSETTENKIPPVIQIGLTIDDGSGREHTFITSAHPRQDVPISQ